VHEVAAVCGPYTLVSFPVLFGDGGGGEVCGVRGRRVFMSMFIRSE